MNKKTIAKMDRRYFLKGVGGTLLALPLLECLTPSKAYGAGVPQKRFIAYGSGNGVDHVDFYPKAATSMILGPNGVRETPLADLIASQGFISNCLHTKFNSVANNVTVVRGLDVINGNGHTFERALCASGQKDNYLNPSLDRYLAKSPNFNTASVIMNALHLGVGGGCISFGLQNGRAVQDTSISNPAIAFDTVFKGVGVSPESTAALKQNKSIIDLVYEQFRGLASSTKLSSGDKQLLQSHADRIRALETNYLKKYNLMCAVPGRPVENPLDSSTYTQGDWDAFLNAYFEVIAIAFQCGITNLATITFNRGLQLKFLPGVLSDHHAYSHTFNPGGPLMQITRYLGDKFVDLINALRVPDPSGDGTILDHTLLYWSNDTGQGHYHGAHDVPVVLAGGRQKYIRLGKLLDYRTEKSWKSFAPYKVGRPHNQVLVSIAQLLGMTPSEYEVANHQGFGNYGDQDGSNTDDITLWGDLGRRTILPGLKA